MQKWIAVFIFTLAWAWLPLWASDSLDSAQSNLSSSTQSDCLSAGHALSLPLQGNFGEVINCLNPEWYPLFGGCTHSPESRDFEKNWARDKVLFIKKLKITSHSVGTMKAAYRVSEFGQNLLALLPLMNALNEPAFRDSKFMKNQQSDKEWERFSTSTVFEEQLSDPEILSKMKDGNFIKDMKNPAFQSVVSRILQFMRDPKNRPALDYFRKRGLSIATASGLQSALRLANAYVKNDLSVDDFNGTDLLETEIPDVQPNSDSDPFADYAHGLIWEGVRNYLINTGISPDNMTHSLNAKDLSDIRALPGLRNLNVNQIADTLDRLAPPVRRSAYDEFIRGPEEKLAKDFKVSVLKAPVEVKENQLAAIDGVARTLWGEAVSCQKQGLAAFEAIGLVIANRSIKIKNSLDNLKAAEEQNAKLEQVNGKRFLDADPNEDYLGVKATGLEALRDFGRTDTDDLPQAQAVSRNGQFTLWTAYQREPHRLSSFQPKLPPNIPDVEIGVHVGLSDTDTDALINALCPGIPQNDKNSKQTFHWNRSFSADDGALWKHAVDIATLIVTDPQHYQQMYQFDPPNPKKPILFYTHGLPLPFADRQPLNGLYLNDGSTRKKLPIIEGRGACGEFRIFAPKPGHTYDGL